MKSCVTPGASCQNSHSSQSTAGSHRHNSPRSDCTSPAPANESPSNPSSSSSQQQQQSQRSSSSSTSAGGSTNSTGAPNGNQQLMTADAFAATKFGSTKLKSRKSNINLSQMSPTQFEVKFHTFFRFFQISCIRISTQPTLPAPSLLFPSPCCDLYMEHIIVDREI